MREHRIGHGKLRSFTATALSVVVALSAAGCGSLPTSAPGTHQSNVDVERWKKRYHSAPNDVKIVLGYVSSLRKQGLAEQAAAVLQRTILQSPNNTELLLAYGTSLVELGHDEQAFRVLDQAHRPEKPDWRIFSARSISLANRGAYSDAKEQMSMALRLAPGRSDLLANMGLINALNGDIQVGEKFLRQALAADPSNARIKENLDFMLGLKKP